MRFGAVFAIVAITTSLSWPALAADDPAAGTEAAAPREQTFSQGELDALVAPIALYPDGLVAQVLMASTYPLEVVQADRFAKENKKLKDEKLKEALEKQDWDASVKELVSTPTVLATMGDKLDWTQKLGDAVLAQQADVMDAIQRLRAKAQANGKLETTKQQTVTVKTVKQEADQQGADQQGADQQVADQQVIEIEPASPDVVYVPYYDPAVVYGEWSYPEYPPYYYPPPSGYIVGGAIATGLAWGAAYAVGREIWNDNIDWNGGDIDIDVDRNIDIDRNVDRNTNIDRNVDRKKWQHDSNHRRGVKYNNDAVRNKFAKADARPTDRKLDYRGRSGEQVLKPGTGDRKPGGVDRPGPGGDRANLGSKGPGQKPGTADRKPGGADRPGPGGDRPKSGKGPGQKPDVGQIQQGLKERSGKQAALQGQKPDLGKAKPKSKPGGNAFDKSDGPKAKDFSKRGQASLGDRGASQVSRPSGGGGPKAARKGGGGGGGHVSRGGGGGRRTCQPRRWRSWRRRWSRRRAGVALTSTSRKTSSRWCGSTTVSNSIASATRAAIEPPMWASWRRRCSKLNLAQSGAITTDI